MHIFVKIGGRKINGRRKTKLLKHIFALFSSYFLKNFLARSARSITFYFHLPISGRGISLYGRDGKVRLAFESGTEKASIFRPTFDDLVSPN